MSGSALPRGAMMTGGGVDVGVVIVLSVAAVPAGRVNQDSSNAIGRVAGIGLVAVRSAVWDAVWGAVWGADLAQQRRGCRAT